MKKLLLLLLISTLSFAQNPLRNADGLLAGSSANNKAASAIIEARSTTKGMLVPRMTTVQRDAIASPLKSLLIFNLTTDKFNYFDGTVWTDFGGDFIPLTGTEAGKPVTGGIELTEVDDSFWIKGANYPDDILGINFSEGSISLFQRNADNTIGHSLFISNSGVFVQSIGGIGGSIGINASNDYTPNYPTDGTEDTIFPQIKYIKDNFQTKLTAGANISIVDDVISASGGGTPTDAKADGTTKGIATFAPNDFTDNSSGLISFDYTNAQKATTLQAGILTASDFSIFKGKQDALVSGTSIKNINSTSLLGSGNIAVEPSITATTSADIFQGDKTFVSKLSLPISTATQTALDLKQAALGFTPYNATNPSGYQTAAQVSTSLSSYVPTARTINGLDLTANRVLTTANIADSTNKRYVTDNQKLFNDANSSIQTQIDNSVKYLVKATTPVTAVTGTTSETIMGSYKINANTLKATDAINVQSFRCVKTGAANAAQRLYINTTPTIGVGSGAVQIVRFDGSSNTYRNSQRTFSIYGGNLYGYDFTNVTTISDVISVAGGVLSSTPINVTADFYLITTAELVNSGNSLQQTQLLITN